MTFAKRVELCMILQYPWKLKAIQKEKTGRNRMMIMISYLSQRKYCPYQFPSHESNQFSGLTSKRERF